MNKDYATHWLLGILCAVIWFWGDRAGIPPTAVSLAGSIVPGLLGHALSFTPSTPGTLVTGTLQQMPTEPPLKG